MFRKVVLALAVAVFIVLVVPVTCGKIIYYDVSTKSWDVVVSQEWSVFGFTPFNKVEVNRIPIRSLRRCCGQADVPVVEDLLNAGKTSFLWRGGRHSSLSRLMLIDDAVVKMYESGDSVVSEYLNEICVLLRSGRSIDRIAPRIEALHLRVLKERSNDRG